ncbi:putative mucin/carbohydrate-binding domain-containing protein [Enterococcus faecalis]|uniref:putative mucin/carbohydrate-binding domain-containing protein n=1 Tax=Enterococcus faecalis TaxID=1351 RepID=UPI0003528C6C|nr:putative mucin/carbohydrate-binding domain-containing protein [Enterococcus faecalis]EPH85028.1 viral enhancin protein [Enterococcus faecalis 06-MB-S-10]EPH85379.1 viral enhancin protein [Enterococcus faecalis 02-MB-BW-10]
MKYIRLGIFMFFPLLITNLSNESVFASEIISNPAKEQTTINGVLTLPDSFPEPVPPKSPDGGADQVTNIKGPFGITYVPKPFTFNAVLKENGKQSIPLVRTDDNVTKFNVGVRDKTRKKDQSWELKASLSWADKGKYLAGASIEAENVNVKENIDGNLQALNNDEVKFLSSTLKISTVEDTVMAAVKGKHLNGTYNYQFANPHLVLPDVYSVASGSYRGNIHWNLVNSPSGELPTDSFSELEKSINELFNGEQLKENVTQQMIDDLQQKLNKLDDSKDKQPLQQKLDQAQKLLNARPFTKEIMVTEKPTNTLNAGILMGSGHDRQDLGIQLEKNATIKIRQTNPKYKENLSLRLLTNDSHTESYTSFGSNEVTVTAKDLSVPFVDTPYIQANGEKPKVEVVIEGGKRELPKYTTNTSLNDFSNKWNTNKGYALLQGSRFQTLFPEENKSQVLSTDLNHVIDLYDNEIIGYYNELIGLSDQASNPINQASNRRYFYKADIHGTGGLYYGGSWAAQTSSSADAWLSDGWGVLHETGHGYQGSFMSRGMNTGEVWNNIYGVIYNYKHMGKEKADQNSWLYDYGNKTRIENYFKQLISSGNMNYNNQGLREQLLILSNLIDKSGNQGLQYFYTKYREYANQNGFDASNYLMPDLLVTNLGQPKKYDFSAVLSAWKTTVKEESKLFAKNQGYQMVSHLAQVVPDDRLQEAINKFTTNNRLSSVLSLVTNKELDAMGLTSNITLQLPDKELFEGTNLKIYRDHQLYREVPLNKESITLDNMPNGVYSLELDSNVGYISQPYLFVKDNQVIKVPLVNYVKEATQAVQSLYQENTDKIKSDIMQKDIDHAKKYVNALPESKEKVALLVKVEDAYNQLQEFTFRGLGDWTFATFDVSNGLATIRINSGQPHVYFTDRYASISITRNGKTIYNKEFIGNQSYSSETNTLSLETGDLIIVTHREANNTRLAVNHSYLKNNENGTYRYEVKNGLLKLIS